MCLVPIADPAALAADSPDRSVPTDWGPLLALPADQQLIEVARRITAMPDQADRLNLATEFFGRRERESGCDPFGRIGAIYLRPEPGGTTGIQIVDAEDATLWERLDWRIAYSSELPPVSPAEAGPLTKRSSAMSVPSKPGLYWAAVSPLREGSEPPPQFNAIVELRDEAPFMRILATFLLGERIFSERGSDVCLSRYVHSKDVRFGPAVEVPLDV
jgi:hypothetical protein